MIRAGKGAVLRKGYEGRDVAHDGGKSFDDPRGEVLLHTGEFGIDVGQLDGLGVFRVGRPDRLGHTRGLLQCGDENSDARFRGCGYAFANAGDECKPRR